MGLFRGDRFVDIDSPYPAIQSVVDRFNEQILPHKKNVELLEAIAQSESNKADDAQVLIDRVTTAKRVFKNELYAAQSRAEEHEKKTFETGNDTSAAIEELATSYADELKKLFNDLS